MRLCEVVHPSVSLGIVSPVARFIHLHPGDASINDLPDVTERVSFALPGCKWIPFCPPSICFPPPSIFPAIYSGAIYSSLFNRVSPTDGWTYPHIEMGGSI